MATVNVYDKLSGELAESHEIEGSLLSWIKDSCPSYSDSVRPPYSATINGKFFPYNNHANALGSDDIVMVTPEPGVWIVPYIPYILAAIAAGYAYYTASNIKSPYESTAEAGKSIYAANARANSIQPSGLIREVAGQITIFPDLICQPHRKYIDNEEWLYLMLSVGRGYFDLTAQNIYIAESPIINYSSDYELGVLEPGDSNSAYVASENWFQSKEVASLRLTTVSTPEVGVWTVDYLTDTITSYLDGDATEFPFVAGERFEITDGSNPGYYEVSSISGADNEIATVIGLARAGGDTGRLEVLSQNFVDRSGGGRGRTVTRNIFDSTGSSALSPATGESVEWSSISGGINYEGPFQAIPVNETSTHAEIDVFFGQGLGDLDSSNELVDTSVVIYIEWRDIGTSSWSRVSKTYTDATYDQTGITETINFGSAVRPEFRFRRVTPDSDSNTKVDLIDIQRVKCKLSSPSSYEQITTIALSLRGTNALASTAENKINLRGASRKLPTLAEIQAESYDLRASVTTISAEWLLDYANYISAAAIGGNAYTPEETVSVSRFSCDFSSDGLNMMAYSSGWVKLFTLESSFDISNISYSGYFSSANEVNACARLGYGGSRVYTLRKYKSPSPYYYLTEINLSTDYDPSTASVGTDFQFDGAEITDIPVSFWMSSNGSFFFLAMSGGTVLKYSLGTAYDLSTTSYASQSYDASAQVGASYLQSIYFGDGTLPDKMYILSGDGITYPYDLGTSGDISTAVYYGQDFSYAANIGSTPRDINVFSDSYIIGSSTSAPDAFVSVWSLPESTDSRATRSIARFCSFALYEAMGSEAITSINWESTEALDTLWTSREDYLDAEFVDETTLWEAIKIMLSPGYCEPTIKEGLFNPVRISSGTDYEQIYTPDIMTDEGLQISSSHYDPQEPDGVDVEYFSLLTNQSEVIECRDSGDLGLRPTRVQAIGITDETKAWRFGMRERNRLRQKPSTYTFTTEMDALNSDYGDPIAVVSDMFAAQFGEVLAVDGPDITLSFEPDFVLGSYVCAFRNREGMFSGLYAVIAGPSSNQITLSSPSSLDFTAVTDGSMDSTLVTFGKSSDWGKRAIVRRITPSSDNMVEVVAEEYVAAIYADDDNEPS